MATRKFLMRKDNDRYVISEQREKEIASVINKHKKLFDKDISQLKGKNLKNRKEADKAVNELLSAYSPFIEKLVEERIKDRGPYMYEKDDYLSEAYLVAMQAARSFDPSRSKKSSMRFSSYCSRPIASAISRMVARSRTEIKVPSSHVINARKWSHTLFELSHSDSDNKNISDEIVSNISGIEAKQEDIVSILNSMVEAELNDNISTYNYEYVSPEEESERTEHVLQAIEKSMIEVFGEKKAKEYLVATGVVTYRQREGEKDIIVLNVDNIRKPNGSRAKLEELRSELSKKRTFNKLTHRIKKYSQD